MPLIPLLSVCLFFFCIPASATSVNGILACLGEPCLHGLCIDHTNSSEGYSCFCENGFTGYLCQTNWNECWSNPCLHGGLCTDGIGAYKCACLPGYAGVDCEVNINECESNPCQNNGLCQDGTDGYECRCQPGFDGEFCQVDISVCNGTANDTRLAQVPLDWTSPRCLQGGRCIDGEGFDFYCECPLGWAGKQCQIDVDECSSDPCQNGGVCLDHIGSYQCACSYGFTGTHCEQTVEQCHNSLCNYRGYCLVENDLNVCYCVPDFHGEACQFQYNECLIPENSCLNGGECIDEVDGSSCLCPPWSSGIRCESVDETWTPPPAIIVATTVEPMTTPSTASVIRSTLLLDTLAPPTSASSLLVTESVHVEDSTDAVQLEQVTQETWTDSAVDFITEEPVVIDVAQLTTSDPLDEVDDVEVSSQAPDDVQVPVEETSPVPASEVEATSSVPDDVDDYSASTDSTVPQEVDVTDETETSTSESVVDFVIDETDVVQIVTEEVPSEQLAPESAATDAPLPEEVDATDATEDILLETTQQPLQAEDTTESPDVSDLPSESPLAPLPSDDLTAKENAKAVAVAPTKAVVEVTPVSVSPMPCNVAPCLNGGQCLLTAKEGWQCRCHWRNEGRRCERLRKIRSPQFHGNSHLSFGVPVKTLEDGRLELRLQFATTTEVGLVAFVHNDDTSVYLAVYIEHGTLKFRLSCGHHQMTLVESQRNVTNGMPQDIHIRLIRVESNAEPNLSYCMGSVKVNNSYSMNGEQRLVDGKTHSWPHRIHIGGRPSAKGIPADILFLPGLVGCTHWLEVNNQRMDMMNDAILGKDVDECVSGNANCGRLSCLNGGTCHQSEQTDGGPLHRCLCPKGWAGEVCELKECPCSPCQGASTCLMAPNDQRLCLCPYGKIGPHCELDAEITKPHFGGTLMGHSAYMTLNAPPFLADHFELRFHFVTDDSQQVSLLLFIGRTDQVIGEQGNNFMAVSFIRGHVALTWDMGSGTRRIFTANPVRISAGGGHSVHIGRRGRVAWLQVNNQPTVTGRSPGPKSVLDIPTQVFLGGHSSYNHSQLPSDFPLHSGFRGCIYDSVFRSRDEDVRNHWIPTVVTGRGVTQCTIPSCRLRLRSGISSRRSNIILRGDDDC